MCSPSIQFYKGTAGTWPYTCTSFTQLYKGRHPVQGSTRYIALHVLALHPALLGHMYIVHPALQEPPQHMTLRVLSPQSALHMLALHPAPQGHTQHMVRVCGTCIRLVSKAVSQPGILVHERS